jgi:dTDP-4-amino-4,6-dideoxygalactose transaminase
LGALGDGGAVCTDSPELAARVRRLRDLGQRRKGEHLELGYNERLDGLQAALLGVKLRHLDRWNEARRRHAASYLELLPAAVEPLHVAAGNRCVYHHFPVRISRRDDVAALLALDGVQTGVHYARAVHDHAAWTGHPIKRGEVRNAERWAAEELSLPMHPDLQANEIEYVVTALEAAIADCEG